MERRLTAILSADVRGYSRLMGDDEVVTIRTLTAYREVMSALILQHQGRVVDSPGDNLLAEFASAVDAVEGAVEIQHELGTRNAELPSRRRMEFRIGINVGDVLVEEERIYGDGVNIAARVESLAAGGGICISGTVYDQVKNKLSLGFVYQGEQAVKNIADPIRVYTVGPDTVESRTIESVVVGGAPSAGHTWTKPERASGKWRHAAWLGAAAGVLVLLSIPMRSWIATADAGPPLDPTKIAVLYFDDLSLDQDLAYLADGLTEALIHALGQIEPLRVISRNGVKPYRDLLIPIDSLARILDVGSLVEGSVERSGDQLVALVRLVDGTTRTQFFSERIVRGGDDLLALRDDIVEEATRLLGQQLGRELQSREVMAGTESSEAWQSFQRAARLLEDADTLRWSLGDSESAKRILGQADSILALAESFDPGWMEPVVQRGWVWVWLASLTAARDRRDEAELRLGISHAERALVRNSQDATALELRGVLRNDLSWLNSIATDSTAVRALRQGAEEDLRAAVGADPSRARAWVALADLLRVGGDFAEASLAAQRALEADPFLINAEKQIIFTLGQVWLDLGDLDRAEAWTDAGRSRYPAEPAFPATALVILSGWEGAEADVQRAWDLSGTLPGWLNGELLVAGVLARAGLADSARAVVERVRPRVADDPWARYYEANTQIQLDNPRQAVVLLGEFLDLMPDRKAYIANDWWWKGLSENKDFQALTATESR